MTVSDWDSATDPVQPVREREAGTGSIRAGFATTKNPPRSIGTVFDAMRNSIRQGKCGFKRGSAASARKSREARLKADLAVDFTKGRK